jgi:hypothetical protein
MAKVFQFILLILFSLNIFAHTNFENATVTINNEPVFSSNPLKNIVKTINVLVPADDDTNTLINQQDYINHAHILYYRYLNSNNINKLTCLKKIQIVAALVAVKYIEDYAVHNEDLFLFKPGYIKTFIEKDAKYLYQKLAIRNLNKIERSFLSAINWQVNYIPQTFNQPD